MRKKIKRGISKDFAKAFRKSELHKLYEKHKDELFIGVRNNYLNLYYNCDSIAKIKYSDGFINCEIDKYYLEGKDNNINKEKRLKISPNQIFDKYQEIKKFSDAKANLEKKAQAKLVISNNRNNESNWFCIDVEYVKQFNNRNEKQDADFNGRFDIIALTKNKPHKVALIELKYGSGALGGTSGIYKHVEDFIKFYNKNYFEEHLKEEIIEIIKSHIFLDISLPFKLPKRDYILAPDFYFITLNNNAEKENGSAPKQTMAGYLFNDKRWGCKRLTTRNSVEKDFGDITKLNNNFYVTFLFSRSTLENMDITDIIDGEYDERIIPE